MKLLILNNLGYIYVIDSDGEKLTSIPEENLELLEFLNDGQKAKPLKLNGTTK